MQSQASLKAVGTPSPIDIPSHNKTGCEGAHPMLVSKFVDDVLDPVTNFEVSWRLESDPG